MELSDVWDVGRHFTRPYLTKHFTGRGRGGGGGGGGGGGAHQNKMLNLRDTESIQTIGHTEDIQPLQCLFTFAL